MKSFRPTWAEINLDAIHQNIHQFRKWLPEKMQMMAVVKADGYGHGALPVAREALAAGATWLGVALMEEALELRSAGITAPILVFGYLPSEAIPVAQQQGIAVTITDAASFQEACSSINPSLPALKFHLKVDTGMGRLGITTPAELEQIIAWYREHTQRKDGAVMLWEGLFTHLATADEEDDSYLRRQINQFETFRKQIMGEGIDLPYVHLANSAGTIRHQQLPTMNLVRIGISMYGLYPSPWMKHLLPFPLTEAFSLHSRLSFIKQVAAGAGISYGRTYLTQEEEWVGTIPIGYADGWSRALSNRSEVLVGGERSKVIGRICMDQCMIRLTKPYQRNELVTLIGRQGKERISIDDIAQLLDTINYEIPCQIGKRVPRRYVKKGCQDEWEHDRINEQEC